MFNVKEVRSLLSVYIVSIIYQWIYSYNENCAVESTDCANGDLRLFGGPNVLEGSLEICIDGIWGGVINNIEGNTKDVACAKMGFNETGVVWALYYQAMAKSVLFFK